MRHAQIPAQTREDAREGAPGGFVVLCALRGRSGHPVEIPRETAVSRGTMPGMADRKGLGWGKWREGVVIGVCSGGILAILTAGFGCISRSFEKREQVQYLAHLIDDYRSRIYTATDFEVGQRFTTRDQLRRVYFDDMVETVNSVLGERSTRLSYDEETEVRLAFGPHELYGNRVLGEGIYDGIFERLDSIEWLGLRRTRSPR